MWIRKLKCSSDAVLRDSASPPAVWFKTVRVISLLTVCAIFTPIDAQNLQPICGRRQTIPSEMGQRIWNGIAAKEDAWPWHVGIYLPILNKPTLACGGSIISRDTILSSAHCFVIFNRLVRANDISVRAGLATLDENTERLQTFNVSKLVTHPQFNTRSGLVHDIALVVLSKDIVVTRYVSPICLWSLSEGQSQIVGKNGTIVGFGLNEHDQLPGFLQEANLTVVDVWQCLASDRATYGAVLTRDMYCAGGNRVSACNGDSGGGMFFDIGGTWHVRGIVSFIPMRPNGLILCDSTKYTVFTDVSKYRRWISEFIDTPRTSTLVNKFSPTPQTNSTTQRKTALEPCADEVIPEAAICNMAHRFESGFLLVNEGTNTIRVPLDGEQTFLFSDDHRGTAIDHDCAEGRFYRASGSKIFSAKYDGTDRKPFILEDIIWVNGVAVDWISRRLYWADGGKNTIEVASLDNPELRTVLVSLNRVAPLKIAVDPFRSKLYWTNSWYSNKVGIEWSNLDGTRRQLLVRRPQVGNPLSIQVFHATGELCYSDNYTKIECIDPDSKQIQMITNNIGTGAIGLAISDELFYWTSKLTRRIESINMDGVRQKPITSRFFKNRLYFMTIVTDKCPFFYSPCAANNGECPEDTICLANPRSPSGKICKCTRNC